MPNGLTWLRMQLSWREMNETNETTDKLIKMAYVGTPRSKLHAKPYKNQFGNCFDFEKPQSSLRKRKWCWRNLETLSNGYALLRRSREHYTVSSVQLKRDGTR